MDKKIILGIDDSQVNNLLMESLFEEDERYTIYTEQDSTCAIRRTIELKPDIILLDLMMPKLNGFGVLNELKSDPGLSEIPVIIVSAKDDPEEKELLLSMGAIDYIRKPVSISKILGRVEEILFHTKPVH